MIYYDPGHWGVACIFRCRGSVFPKAMVWALPCTVVAGVLHYTFHHNDKIMEALGIGDVAATVFGGFNFILGFLVVFRSQQAYARWWEGATLLQQVRGEWFNSFSSLVAFSNAAPDKQVAVAHFQQQLVRLYSLLYGAALAQVSSMDQHCFELINLDGFDEESLKFLRTCSDKCEVTLQWIQRLIVEAEQKTIIKIAPPILSRVYNELGNGIVNLNNARKIREFPMPFPLAQMIMVMLMFHLAFTPLICAATLTSPAWAALLTFVVIFSFWSVLYISLELEMPFGDDPNDLPLQQMAEAMNTSLRTLIDPLAASVPGFTMPQDPMALQAKLVDFDSDMSETARSSVGHWIAWKLDCPGQASPQGEVTKQTLPKAFHGCVVTEVISDALSPSTREAVPSPTPMETIPLEVKVQGAASDSRSAHPEIHRSAPDRPMADGALASDSQAHRSRDPESAHSSEISTPQPARTAWADAPLHVVPMKAGIAIEQ